MSAPPELQDVAIVLEPLPPIDTLAPQWREFDRTGPHAFFLTWTWMGTWLRMLPSSAAPVLLKVMRGTEIAGLAFLSLKKEKLRGIFPIRQVWLNATGDPALDCVTIEHNGFASAGPYDDAFLTALAKSFASDAIPADELVLPGVASGVPTKMDFINVEWLSPAFRAPLRGLGGREGIEPILSSNTRQKLRRSMRAYEREGPLSLEVAGDTKTALEFFAGMKELHMRSWTRRRRRHAFDNPFFETFHRALIAAGVADGNVDLLRVSAGASTLGYLYNFRRNGMVVSYQSGFDDQTPGLRPGYVCHALAMAHYAGAGMTHYDFLAGANRLKQSFGTERYELCWRRLRKPTLGFRAEALARRGIEMLNRNS